MPREQLAALAADVDRLLAAGASAAAGNDGLRRRSQTLRELANKVAALTPVAVAVDRVLQSPTDRSAPALLDLLVLTRQIRAGLCTSHVPGDFRPFSASGPWQTPMPVRDVPPLVGALTRPGSGRETLLKDALVRKALSDLRLVSPLVEALDDGHGPIADLVAQEALPAMGRAVLGELIAGLDLQGKAADARRLLVTCNINAPTGAELCRKALREGSQPVRVQALECFPDVSPVEEAEQCGLAARLEKNREVRAAALWAMRNSSSAQVLDALIGSLLSDEEESVRQSAADALIQSRNPRTSEQLLTTFRTLLNTEQPGRSGFDSHRRL